MLKRVALLGVLLATLFAAKPAAAVDVLSDQPIPQPPGLSAILHQRTTTTYVSPGIAGDPLLKNGEKLKKNGKVKVRDGRELVASANDIDMDGKRLRVVTFAPPR